MVVEVSNTFVACAAMLGSQADAHLAEVALVVDDDMLHATVGECDGEPQQEKVQ